MYSLLINTNTVTERTLSTSQLNELGNNHKPATRTIMLLQQERSWVQQTGSENGHKIRKIRTHTHRVESNQIDVHRRGAVCSGLRLWNNQWNVAKSMHACISLIWYHIIHPELLIINPHAMSTENNVIMNNRIFSLFFNFLYFNTQVHKTWKAVALKASTRRMTKTALHFFSLFPFSNK